MASSRRSAYISLRPTKRFTDSTARPEHSYSRRQNGSLSPMHLVPIPAILMFAGTQLTHLAPIDIAILLLYFVMVVFIGFYVKGSTNTSEQFFLAGREMTAWIAGLSFVSANLGSLELMGWAGAAYQYGILATHW